MTVSKRRLDELVELRFEKWGGPKDPARPYIGLEHLAQGFPQLLGYLPSSESVSINCLFEKDDILFGKLRPNLRKSIRAPFAGYCSTDILVLRAREGTLPAFAGHVFQWEEVFNAAMATAAGTKMPRTSWNELRRFRIAYPDATIEQAELSHILGTIDAAIEETRLAITKLKQVRAGLIHDLLTCGLDDNGELRDPIKRPDQFAECHLGTIPKSWRIDTFDSACSLVKDGTHLPPPRVDDGPLLLGVQNMVDDRFVLTSSDTRVPLSFFKQMHSKWAISADDVLLAIVGATIGKVARVPANFPLFTIQRSVALLRGRQEVLDNDYLEIFLRSEFFQTYIKRSLNQTAQPGLYLAQIASGMVLVPSIAEQRMIASIMYANSQQIDSEQDFLTKLTSLKYGLMSDLLSGRKPVPATIATGASA